MCVVVESDIRYAEWVHAQVKSQRLADDPLALGNFFAHFLSRTRISRREEYEAVARLLLQCVCACACVACMC
jgi:hypothetical protein